MTVALSDTQLLCDMLRPLHSFGNPVATATTTSRFYTLRKPLSATINTLANALYRVSPPPPPPPESCSWHLVALVADGLIAAFRLRCIPSWFRVECRCFATLGTPRMRRCSAPASITCAWAGGTARAPSPCCQACGPGHRCSSCTSSLSQSLGWAGCCCRGPRSGELRVSEQQS